jgi:hypothetical protein
MGEVGLSFALGSLTGFPALASSVGLIVDVLHGVPVPASGG